MSNEVIYSKLHVRIYFLFWPLHHHCGHLLISWKLKLTHLAHLSFFYNTFIVLMADLYHSDNRYPEQSDCLIQRPSALPSCPEIKLNPYLALAKIWSHTEFDNQTTKPHTDCYVVWDRCDTASMRLRSEFS